MDKNSSRHELSILFEKEGVDILLPNHHRMILEDNASIFFLDSGNLDLLIMDLEKTPYTERLLADSLLTLTPQSFDVFVGTKIFIQNLGSETLLFPFPWEKERSIHLLLRSNQNCLIKKMPIETFRNALQQSKKLNQEFQLGLKSWISFFTFLYTSRRLDFAQHVLDTVPTKLNLKQNEVLVAANTKDFQGLILSKGDLHLIGMDSLLLSEDPDLIYPINQEMWFKCTSKEADIETHSLNDERIWKGLGLFHRHLITLFIEAILSEHMQKVKFAEKSQLSVQNNFESSKKELQQILHNQEFLFKKTDSVFLYRVLDLVANNLKIKLKPPAEFSPNDSIESYVNKITYDSGIYKRVISLKEGWWRESWGPIMGFYKDLMPVALIPTGDQRYRLIDVRNQKSLIVDEKIDEELEKNAYVIYRPLPDKKQLSGSDLLKFSLKDRGKLLIGFIMLNILALFYAFFFPFANKILYGYIIPINDPPLLVQLTIGLVLILSLSTLFSFAKERLFLYFKGLVEYDLQIGVWQRIFQLPIQFFRKYEPGDLLMRAYAIEQIRNLISGPALRALINALFSILFILPMLYFSPVLTLVGVCLIAPVILFNLSNIITTYKNSLRIVEEKVELNALIIQLIRGITKIRNAGAEKLSYVLWEKQFFKLKKEEWALEQLINRPKLLNFTFQQTSTLLIFGVILLFINDLGNHPLSLGNFLGFLAVFSFFRNSILEFSDTLIEAKAVVPLWKNSQVIFQEPPETSEDRIAPPKLQGEIRMDHVSFRYDADGPLILDDVSIQVFPNEFVAIVGSSGSGKSTIVRLLIGFEVPESGAIYFDGKDLANLNLRQLRTQIGTILQSSTTFESDLRENVTLGEIYTDEEVIEALTIAGFGEDLKRLPMGLKTLISQAQSISGGQKQRIILARTFISKSKIMIYDEATSALDNQVQEMVSQHLSRLKVTRIVIAHRLSTIKKANRIYVLDKAKIVEEGTFDELLEKKGFFYHMVNQQKFSLK